MKKRDDIYLYQIAEKIDQIKKHLRGVSKKKFLSKQLYKSAIVRELEIIGEAARLVSENTRNQFPEIPWNQMIGMRNRLIHEYFDVDYEIVWEVANSEIPKLEKHIQEAILKTAPPIHPWRNCPIGYYYVHPYKRATPQSAKHPDGVTSVREHCRRNPSGKDQLYPKEIKWISESQSEKPNNLGKIGKLSQPNNANEFDQQILIWTRYWNEIFNPRNPLDPNIVKALFGSESSFKRNVKDKKVSAKNFARGPLQITDETRKILSDEDGEIKDHYLTLTKNDVADPNAAIAAAVRWLFYKKESAERRLNREISWDETVAEYKGYLRKNKNILAHKGMRVFLGLLSELRRSDQ